MRDERIRTNRAQFEAPPPTESAAAKATRPRLSRERWPGRSHAPQTRAHIESCPEGNYSDLPQRRCPARTPHTGRPRELSVVRVRKPCDTSRIHSFALSGGAFARAAVRNRNCEGRTVFAPNAGRKRNAPAAFQRPTALLTLFAPNERKQSAPPADFFFGRLRLSSHTTCGAAHARDHLGRGRSAI